jgi:hypothetical protein
MELSKPQLPPLHARISAIVRRIPNSDGTEIPSGVADYVIEQIMREVRRGG